VIADEILDLIAEKQAALVGHEDELYSRLDRFDPYQVFSACIISLQKRVDSIPANQRRERYQKLASRLKQAIQTVRDTDGWDGHSPSLEDLLSKGGA
jgi:tRNA 2-selenouridine synthase SelU